eukprot:TRINITY_DN4087_c0_g1_i1.p1 TRINITY_DN4087_c0_g1~~TRINITY_DN4087_c0_g1_i1.p1  ORF type:complete len:371 (-),score=57.58 TRINITY_DN4087_c0_g1_i1:57-1169(-)
MDGSSSYARHIAPYQLGTTLDRAAWLQISEAINMETGETATIFLAAKSAYGNLSQLELHQRSQALAFLTHPNLAKFYALLPDEECAAFAVEYVESSLAAIVLGHGCFPEQLVAHYARQTLAALAYLAAQGFEHKDVRPATVLLTRQGSVRLAPPLFGRTLSDNPLPEGTRADLWGLGLTIFEVVVGESLSANHHRLHATTPALRPDFSHELQAFLRLCWNKYDGTLVSHYDALASHAWVGPGTPNPPAPLADVRRSVQMYNVVVRSDAGLLRTIDWSVASAVADEVPADEKDEFLEDAAAVSAQSAAAPAQHQQLPILVSIPHALTQRSKSDGKPFTVYQIDLVSGKDTWTLYRRYSQLLDLHKKVFALL